VLNIPPRIKDLLESDMLHYGFVMESITKLTPWLNDNKTVFFPEYTDHGFVHINEVLQTAASIVTDESYDILSPADAAAMVVSILLHDCAMHLTEDGFYSLVNDKFPKVRSQYIADEPAWSLLWSDFIAEAKRFDARKLNSLFGDSNPVKDVPPRKIDLTGRDRMLVGEFIRRHHARLAHEVAFYGVPGCDGKGLTLAAEPCRHFLDLCGFIARSHNMSLRDAVDRITQEKRQVHQGAHAPFLMLVLRISDYIQVQAGRAPSKLLEIKTLISPLSKGEWKKHDSILEINHAHNDPEAIYIDAEPEDAVTFEGLRSLFKDIQKELDVSWSVLGEVYGRYDTLRKLGLSIRRIRSSLDDANKFVESKRPNYIPKVLKFRTADTEMMELLIAPLYGNKPEIGIRELVQNAIDASNELKDLVIKQQLKRSSLSGDEVHVTVIEEDGGGEVIIQDFGVGMTLEIVENYFLNVGASFRNSDRWKKEHETDGHSNVFRTGRFGVGLLAAYLLGDSMRVTTRHASEPENAALTFECSKTDGPIVVENTTAPIGTRISITVNKSVLDSLKNNPDRWDWYCLESPRVVRRLIVDKAEVMLGQSRKVPSADAELPAPEWHRTRAEGFDDVFWTYQRVRRDGRSQSLVCNGIVITDHLSLPTLIASNPMRYIEIAVPSLVVFDQDGRLPINLQRSDLVNRSVPFEDILISDICDQAVVELESHCRLSGFSDFPRFMESLIDLPIAALQRSGYSSGGDKVSKLIICDDSKILPLDYSLMRIYGIQSLTIDATNFAKKQGAWSSKEFSRKKKNYLAVDGITNTKQSRSYWIRVFFELQQQYYHCSGFSALPVVGRRILIKNEDIDIIVAPGYVPRTFWNKLTTEWRNARWSLLSIGKIGPFEYDPQVLSLELDASGSFGVIFCDFDWSVIPSPDEKSNSPFSVAWLRRFEGSILDLSTGAKDR